MTNEIFEKAIDTAENNGFYKERASMLENILYALIDSANCDYSGERITVDRDILTALLRMFDSNAVDVKIAKCKELKENDG